ncbi:MAG: hypothetical protein CVU71_11615 [Deltaproteobacteria bacterium HGW-Deltaproteobacteria-6]|jgi:hypothetical protein|nr:MAG: hypothetical protein CVU71_11615 [Deltaproteobacteria bacterium HGW-Deltaproteobacteria-6]PKN96179.1 MAG: hypothetical protein CVU43_22050 [Chloroflexi bacterium HGW-Chloroflexi-5]
MKWIKIILILLLTVAIVSCRAQEAGQESKTENSSPAVSFNPDTLKIPDKGGRKLKGQVLYMPIYSNIPSNYKQLHNLSAFLAIHNTDLNHQIKITKADYFNTEGIIVRSFISAEQSVKPLATIIFTISKEDQSGTGSNFIVEWMAERPVNEPLIESVMIDLSGNLGLSFLSSGRVIREIR